MATDRQAQPTEAQRNQLPQGNHSPNQCLNDVPMSNPNENMFTNGEAWPVIKGTATADQKPGRSAFKY